MSRFTQFTNILLGKPLASHEEEGQRVGVLSGIPMLGLDALGSASYGPEAALTLLIPLGALGLQYIGPISGIIIAILLIVYVSYRQTITAYPKGGGSYTVARENLGKRLGLLAAAALLLDYILVVAVGISAGVGALVSAVPGQAGYQSILSQLVAAVVGRNWFYYVTIASILAVLAFSANTGFADFPRLCRVMAHDGFLPHSFAIRGRRLAFSQGIITLAVIAGLLLIAFRGITDHLIPLFAVGAFLAFTLSQAGMVVHWQRVGGEHARRNMFINGLGAVATAVTLIVVLVAKFSHGAWITLVMLPLMLVTFLAIKRHYNNVAREVASYEPVDVTDLRPPIVIVPLRGWSKMSRKAMRFALKLSPDVCGVQISVTEETPSLQAQWEKYVVAPTRTAGMEPPQLVVIESPYRRLAGPLLDYILKVIAENPDRQVAVVISELMEARWYHYFLHKQRAESLRLRLLLSGDERIIIINIPWYLRR